MGNHTKVLKIDTIQSLNDYLGVKSPNSLFTVVDLWKVGDIKQVVKRYNLYCVILVHDDKHIQGYDAYLYFVRPGQYGHSKGVVPRLKGWLLCFHPDLLQGTLLVNRMSEYPFFRDSLLEPLNLNIEEAELIDNYMRMLYDEQFREVDRYTKRIIASGISVIITQCLRLYDRQLGCAQQTNNDIVRRMDILLNDHFSSPVRSRELPTVAWCAEKLNLSANYLGDLMRKHGNVSAQEHIHRRIVDEIKIYLERDNCSIGHIAYMLGFKHPHHLSRLFRKVEGCTPIEYRQRCNKIDANE
jgi:AraC-like DNA-binding protein